MTLTLSSACDLLYDSNVQFTVPSNTDKLLHLQEALLRGLTKNIVLFFSSILLSLAQGQLSFSWGQIFHDFCESACS